MSRNISFRQWALGSLVLLVVLFCSVIFTRQKPKTDREVLAEMSKLPVAEISRLIETEEGRRALAQRLVEAVTSQPAETQPANE